MGDLVAGRVITKEVVLWTSPEFHGAKAQEGIDDTAAINAALLLGAGKHVFFGHGKTYWVNGSLLKVYPNTTLHLHGATIKMLPGSYTAGAYFFGNSTQISWPSEEPEVADVKFFGGLLDGNIANVTTTNGTTGIHAYRAKDWVIEDVTIKDLAGDIGVGYGVIGSMSNGIRMNRCKISRTPRSNVYIWETKNFVIDGCTFEGSHYRDCVSAGGNIPLQLQSSTFSITNSWMKNTLSTSTHVIRCSGPCEGFLSNVDLIGYIAGNGGGKGAKATVTVSSGVVTTITVTNGGSGYVTAPMVKIIGGGTGATATATISGGAVTAINVTAGGTGYSLAEVQFISGGSGAIATSVTSGGAITAINVTAIGSKYDSSPEVRIYGGGGRIATATASVADMVNTIAITNGGSGYTSAPDISITGGNGSGATAVATITDGIVTGITITARGTGYTAVPTVSFSGGEGTGAAATVTVARGVSSIAVTDGGSGYTGSPTVYIGTGTEGIYITSEAFQDIKGINVRINNAYYGILVESNIKRNVEFTNLSIGAMEDCVNGVRVNANGTTIKLNGGTIKALTTPLYINFTPSYSVQGVDLIGGTTASTVSSQIGGMARFVGNGANGNTNTGGYCVLFGGDGEPIIVGNRTVGNTANLMRCITSAIAYGNNSLQVDGVLKTGMLAKKGTTAARPTLTSSDTGALHLDTTLAASGMPIFWTGSQWVTALGNTGEHVSSLIPIGSAVSLTNNVATNVTSVVLTAGEWDVEGNVNLSASGATVTAMSAGGTSTSSTVPTDGSEVYDGQQSTTTTFKTSLAIPRKRISLSATTTIYMVAKVTFSAGTVAAFGAIIARRSHHVA